MNVITEVKIAPLLSGFAMLSKAQQDRFMDGLNRYVMASPRQRLVLRNHWATVHTGSPAAVRETPLVLSAREDTQANAA